jgi:hypothetical protein
MRFVCLLPAALLANQAFFAFAAFVDPFVVQDQNTLNVGDGFCKDSNSPPRAYLDDAAFNGVCLGRTARFLGIPFAQPP